MTSLTTASCVIGPAAYLSSLNLRSNDCSWASYDALWLLGSSLATCDPLGGLMAACLLPAMQRLSQSSAISTKKLEITIEITRRSKYNIYKVVTNTGLRSGIIKSPVLFRTLSPCRTANTVRNFTKANWGPSEREAYHYVKPCFPERCPSDEGEHRPRGRRHR